MEVNLQDLLLSTRQLSSMADVYDDVVAQVSAAASADGDVFETPELQSAWVEVAEKFWTICSDSQDNLNQTSLALVRYINAVCEQDTAAAEELEKDIKSYNDAQFSNLDIDDDGYIEKGTEQKKGGYSDDQFKELDSNGDGKISKTEQRDDSVHETLPEPDMGNKGEVIEEPKVKPAERPEGK